MKIPDLDELINKFQDAGLTHLEIRNGDEEVILKKNYQLKYLLQVQIHLPNQLLHKNQPQQIKILRLMHLLLVHFTLRQVLKKNLLLRLVTK